MNKSTTLFASFALAATLSFAAQADDTTASGTNAQPQAGAAATTPAKPASVKRPCAVIIKACKDAGFSKGAHQEGKGLIKSCLTPILAGQTVQGVTVDPAIAQACKQKRQDKKAQ